MSMVDTALLSDEVLQLVRSVQRLEDEDQARIVKMVRLLALVTPSVRDRTQRMLKALLESKPHSMYECIAGMNEVIEYLENSLPGPDRIDAWDLLERPTLSRWN